MSSMASCRAKPQTSHASEMHYPADFHRMEHVMGLRRSKCEEEREEAFQRLNKLCQAESGKRLTCANQTKALAKWCQEYADTLFPGIGQVAYALPSFFVGKHDLNPTPVSFKHKQESEVRGDNAQAKVDSAFRLLNQEMERRAKEMTSAEQKKIGQQGKKISTMFIIDNVLFENVLIWLEDIQRKKTLKTKYPNLEAHGTAYYTRKCGSGSGERNRWEVDIAIIHEKKGVIFVEVKSFGTYGHESGTDKLETVRKQLNDAETTFNQLFEHKKELTGMVCKVLALPNMTTEEAKRRCGITDDDKDGIRLLSKDHLFDDDKTLSEAEYDLGKLHTWLEALPDRPIKPEVIKDIVARLTGTFSKPRELLDKTERNYIMTVADSISVAGKMFKTRGLNLSDKEIEAITSTDAMYNRVHVHGPPGSGRTTLLVLKSLHFLGTPRTKTGQVVVLDIYRGFRGRPIGVQITKAIQDAEEAKFKNRVHHLPIDLYETTSAELFTKEVQNLIRARVRGLQWQDVLFIIDEMLPQEHLSHIFEALRADFKDSLVWCADGLISQELMGTPAFRSLDTDLIYRLPTSIQKVLYHADWDDQRKEQYAISSTKQDAQASASSQQAGRSKKPRTAEKDTTKAPQPGPSSAGAAERCNVCTPGPTALCIKHQHHDPTKTVLECAQCAEDLADLLKNKTKLVDKKPACSQAKPTGASASAAASSAPTKPRKKHGQSPSFEMEVDEAEHLQAASDSFLPCSIVILFSIPSENYHLYEETPQSSNRVELTKDDLDRYLPRVQDSTFITQLRRKVGVPVELYPTVTGSTRALDQNPDCEDNWDKILVSWVDIFQGLERDVVIFLPSERTAQKEEAGSTLQTASKGMNTLSIEEPPSPDRPRLSPRSPGSSPGRMTRSRASAQSPSSSAPEQGVKRQAEALKADDRKIPEPGLANEPSRQPVSRGTRSALGASPRREEEDPEGLAASATGRGAGGVGGVSGERGMSGYYWRTKDIQRYTDWDKTNLMFAATRCTSQLIMLVP